MDIRLPGISESLAGTDPVIILGANGSGKTRLAVNLAQEPNVDFIPALRNLSIPDQLHNWTLQRATSELQSRNNQHKSRHWEFTNEIDVLFAKLLSAHASQAMNVYDHIRKNEILPPINDTIIDKISELWSAVFSGRKISFNDYTPLVTSEYQSGSSYAAKQMSDGERTGLYLAARVLDSTKHVIIVDEPETHFHSRLAVRFWDALESQCKNKRFIYVTHDLTFALSRKNAQIVLARADQPLQLLESLNKLPTDDINAILGAASFSIYARRIVFCEGEEGKSLDQELLRAWFHDRETALIPVGGCENVKRCAAALAIDGMVNGLKAIGIIDRDHWPDDLLDNCDKNIHVLKVHEIESLYSIPEVYIAVAIHLGTSKEEAKDKYHSAIDIFIKNNQDGTLINKLISCRFKALTAMLFERVFSGKLDYSNRDSILQSFSKDLTNAPPVTSTRDLWDKEVTFVESALGSKDPHQILRVFPGKPILPALAKSLGVSKDRYCEIVKEGLNSTASSMIDLSKGLEKALRTYLPSRKYEDEA